MNDAPAFLQAWNPCYQRGHRAFSDAALAQARRSWFDTLAALAGGLSEPCVGAALQASAASGAPGLAAGDSALVLGTATHALDYDDVCMLATCHPSAPPVAALLALPPALLRGLTWGDLLAAYLVGTETTLRLGQWLGFRHYALGFHATATLGAIGAAAACAHALRLPLAPAHAALSIAASSAGGLRANFGTDVKPLHVGLAASAGLRAALLARAGATASNDVWRDAGFFHAFNGGQALVPLAWRSDQTLAIETPGFEHKRFPSCYMTHRMIAGILAIRARHPTAAQALRIEVEVPKNGLAALKHPSPSTGLEAKFSGQYCAAAAWIDHQVRLASFTDDAVQRAALREQMAQVVLRERAEAGEQLDTAPVTVTVHGPDWSDSQRVDWAPGSQADPMTREQLLAKWDDCAAHGGVPSSETQALGLLDAPLESAPASWLAPLCDRLLAVAARTAGLPPIFQPSQANVALPLCLTPMGGGRLRPASGRSEETA